MVKMVILQMYIKRVLMPNGSPVVFQDCSKLVVIKPINQTENQQPYNTKNASITAKGRNSKWKWDVRIKTTLFCCSKLSFWHAFWKYEKFLFLLFGQEGYSK